MKRVVNTVVIAVVALPPLCRGAERVTARDLGFSPTDHPVGTCLVPSSTAFRRVGEGSFALLENGGIALFFDARKKTGDLHTAIIRRMVSADGGKTWSEAATVLREAQASILQPSLCRMNARSIIAG